MEEIKINDIKSLADIPDFSLYLYMLLWILAVLAVFIIVFLIYKYFYNKKRCKRKEYYRILKELDLNDSKNSAYTITKYSKLLAKTQRELKLYSELNEELEKYKYKKNVEPFSEDVKIVFGRFMDSLDV